MSVHVNTWPGATCGVPRDFHDDGSRQAACGSVDFAGHGMSYYVRTVAPTTTLVRRILIIITINLL